MAVEIKRRSPRYAQDERLMVTGMIVSETVLRSVSQLWRPELCATDVGRIVGQWCVDYWSRYQKPPGDTIQDIFMREDRQGTLDDASVKLVREFLVSIEDEYDRGEHFNAEYARDKALEHLKARDLEDLRARVGADLAAGNVLEAESAVAEHKRVELPSADGVNPFTNKDVLYEAFEHGATPLFSLPGPIGELLNEHLIREGLVLLQGPMKRGKTWWLQELGFVAAKARNNVAWFGVGDMSLRQMVRRKAIRLTGRSDQEKYCREIDIPILDCFHNQTDDCDLHRRVDSKGAVLEYDDELKRWSPVEEPPSTYRPCTACLIKERRHRKGSEYKGAHWFDTLPPRIPLDWRAALKAGRQFDRDFMRGRDYKLVCYPNNTVNVTNLESQLGLWEQDGFVADVIVIDYADILAPEFGSERKEKRLQIDDTFMALRRLSQEKRCLIITATQAAADALEAPSQRLRHFSESVRKYAHVTATVALNQTEADMRERVMRVGLLNVREGAFDIGREVVVLQCLESGKPILRSYWR